MEDNYQTDTIDLQELFFLIKKNVVLIALITILFTTLVGLATVFGMTKKYSSETTVYVHPSSKKNENATTYDFNQAQELINDITVLIKSRTVLSDVIEQLDLKGELEVGQLREMIEVSSVGDSRFISIEVTATEANKAASLANTIATVFQDTAPEKLKIPKENLEVMDPAEANESPVSPNLKLNLVIGFVLGGMVSVGIVLLREFLDRTIRVPKDVERYLKVPVLGSVPNME